MKRAICILVAAFYVSACSSLNTVPYAAGDSASNPIRAGDRIVVKTSSREHSLEVTSASDDEVCGVDECIRADRIESVQREEVSPSKTMGVLLLLVLGIGLFAAVHSASLFAVPVFPH